MLPLKRYEVYFLISKNGRRVKPQDLADLDALMHDLSATSFCNEELLNNALNDANVHVYVIRDEGHIVATGTLCIKHTLEFTIAGIESVVVSSKCRGRGY